MNGGGRDATKGCAHIMIVMDRFAFELTLAWLFFSFVALPLLVLVGGYPRHINWWYRSTRV